MSHTLKKNECTIYCGIHEPSITGSSVHIANICMIHRFTNRTGRGDSSQSTCGAVTCDTCDDIGGR